jgi:hypothetical protein
MIGSSQISNCGVEKKFGKRKQDFMFIFCFMMKIRNLLYSSIMFKKSSLSEQQKEQ